MMAILAGCAQIIIVVIGQTGLGVKFSSLISMLNQSNLFLGLLISMVICLILGMGIPTVAAYVVAASVVGAPLVQSGLDPLTVHLFLFYFALISGITPPVCTSVYVASALANANWMKTAAYSMRIGLPAFIVPYMFVYGEQLLMRGTFVEIITALTTATIGVIALSGGTIGYFVTHNKIWETCLLLIGALLSIIPETVTDMIGITLIAVVFVAQRYVRKENDHGAYGTAVRS